MIELDRHIEILLLDNDCVIVPELGGFMAHYCPAHLDSCDNAFLPPSRSIGFNAKITLNDSLLAQSYVEAYDISYPEAVRRISDEVREVRQHLETNGHYTFNDLGVMRLNAEGNLEFEPCEAGILTPYLYGLTAVQLPSLQELKQTEAVLISANTAAVNLGHAETDKPETTEDEVSSPDYVRLRLSWVRNIAAACIALIAFVLLPAPLNNSTIQSKIDTDMLFRIMPKEVTTGESATQQAIKQQTSQIPTPAKVSEPTVASPTKTIYTLVLASRVTKANAKRYADELHHKGYDKAEVLVKNGRAKVVYGNFDTRDDAQKALNDMNHIAEFAEAWITHYTTQQ